MKDSSRTDWMIRNVSSELKHNAVKRAKEEGYPGIGPYMNHVLTVYFLHDKKKPEQLPAVVPENKQTLKELSQISPKDAENTAEILHELASFMRILAEHQNLPRSVKAAVSKSIVGYLSALTPPPVR